MALSGFQLTEWNKQSSAKEVMHRTQRDMYVHERNNEGFISYSWVVWNKYCNWIFAIFPLNMISKFCSLINFLFFCAKNILHYCTHRFTCKALTHSHWVAPVHQQRRALRSSVFMFILIIFHLSICVWVSWSYVFSKPGS